MIYTVQLELFEKTTSCSLTGVSFWSQELEQTLDI